MENEVKRGYRSAIVECWKCKRDIEVYTWQGHEEWGEDEPPEPKPNTVRWMWSGSIRGYYWANACEGCGAIQGDWYLYDEPDGPFYARSKHLESFDVDSVG